MNVNVEDKGLSSLKNKNISDKAVDPLKDLTVSATDKIQFGPANLINNDLGDDLINKTPGEPKLGNHFIQL